MTVLQPYTHAKMAHAFVHAPLFRSLEKGQQQKQKLDITYAMGDTTFRFWGPDPLIVSDLRVFQGLVAEATRGLHSAAIKQLFKDGNSQRRGLNLAGDALTERSIAVRFKITSFARAIGYARPGQETLKRIRGSIARLSAVTIIIRQGAMEGSSHLLSGYVVDTCSGDVVVGMNPVVTKAVLGKNGYLRLNFKEVLSLKSDPARLIHSRLHWINQGETRSVKLDTLCGYLSGDSSRAPAVCNRRVKVRKALDELRGLGWDVAETRPGSFSIRRPR